MIINDRSIVEDTVDRRRRMVMARGRAIMPLCNYGEDNESLPKRKKDKKKEKVRCQFYLLTAVFPVPGTPCSSRVYNANPDVKAAVFTCIEYRLRAVIRRLSILALFTTHVIFMTYATEGRSMFVNEHIKVSVS